MKNKAQEDFFSAFEAISGDKGEYMTMARFCGSAGILDLLNLELPAGGRDLWGLFIFGRQNLHFYVHAWENSIAALVRTAARSSAPHEQHAVFLPTDIKDIIVGSPPRGLSALFRSRVIALTLSLRREERDIAIPFECLAEHGDLLNAVRQFRARALPPAQHTHGDPIPT